jgi:hypothetical protein
MTTVGCFGSVVYFDPEGRRCNACSLKGDCQVKVTENEALLGDLMAQLRGKDKTTSKARKRAMSAVASTDDGLKSASDDKQETRETKPVIKASDTSGLNVKAAEFVHRWEAKGIDFGATKSGVNPFTGSGNKFAVVAVDLLLQRGSCTKMEMTDHLIEHAGARGPWGSGTACSHTNIVFEAFAHLGIIEVSGGKAYLKR